MCLVSGLVGRIDVLLFGTGAVKLLKRIFFLFCFDWDL